jgi:hypothetical protein
MFPIIAVILIPILIGIALYLLEHDNDMPVC